MRRSKTLARLRAGQPVRMAAVSHFLPAAAKHAAHFGFDCLWWDLEHRTMSEREVQAFLAFCHLFDIDCMVRSPTLEKIKLYRYFEDGAAGLMIPHCNTAERAKQIVDAVKFPPIGDRGLDGAGLDSDFYIQGGLEFTDQANAETFIVVQIETPEAIENIDAIAATPGIDVLFIGPGDLSLRIRKNNHRLTLAEATDRVAEAAAKHGKVWGIPVGSAEQLREMTAKGARFCNYGGDFGAVMAMLEKHSKEMTELFGNPALPASSTMPKERSADL